MTDDKNDSELHDCGYPEDTFACKIRHLQINTGAAKASPRPWSTAYAQEEQKRTGYNRLPGVN